MVSPLYHPSLGGVGRQAVALTEHLHYRGVPVFVICRKMFDLPAWQPVSGIDIIKIPSLGARRINLQERTIANLFVSLSFSLCLVAALLRCNSRYDIVHFHGASLPLLISSLPLRIMGKKIIVKVAGAKMGIEAGSFRGRYGILGNLFVQLLRRVDAFVAISDEIRADLRAEGYQDGRIHRISNFVLQEVFFPLEKLEDKPAMKRALVGTDRFILTFSGRLARTKRLDILLLSLKSILIARRDVHLVILGDGEMRSELEHMTEELGITGHVTFCGFVQNVTDYLQATDIFVFPSEREGMPNALLEAMACRITVVAADTIANAEIIRNGDNGLLFRAGDADDLRRKALLLLDDVSHRELLAARGHETVCRSFQIAETAEKYRELYEQVLRK